MEKHILSDPRFQIICDSERYTLGGLDECTYIFDKVKNSEILLCEFYGNCSTGVINERDNWCVAAGNSIAIWKNDIVTVIDRKELNWAFDMRIKERNIVEILIDPWSDFASIWELNVDDMSFRKTSAFYKYRDQPQCDNVDW